MTLSPDGKWMWDGGGWIPVPPSVAQPPPATHMPPPPAMTRVPVQLNAKKESGVSAVVIFIAITLVVSGGVTYWWINDSAPEVWPLSSSFTLSHSDPTSTYASANANPTGGTEPYQYQWVLDGIIQSRTMSYIDFYDLSVGSHSVELRVMDSKGEMQSSTQTIVVEASQVWVPDWKINIEFQSFTPRAIASSDVITMEFYWDDSNTGEFEEGVLCTTWDRSDGDDVFIPLSKKCVVDISDETHQVGYTACAYIDDGSSSSEKIDIHSVDGTYGSCLLVKDIEIDGQYDYETMTYDGLNDNDDNDIPLHGKLVVYWEWIDDGEYVDED